MANPSKDYGLSIWARFQALKDELQHLVLAIREDSDLQGGESFASRAAFNRAKEVLSMRELKGILSKVSPLPISTSSAHNMVSHGNVRLGSSRYEQLPHSIFIENFPSNINVEQLETKLASFGNVVDAYIQIKLLEQRVPKHRLDVEIPHVRNYFDGINGGHISQKVAIDSLENTQAKEAANSHENIEQHRFEMVNLEGYQEVCSDASRMIFLPIGQQRVTVLVLETSTLRKILTGIVL
ncbi:hypothetical protein Cgig2_022615 [Carnegiea gigantea]|uniref:RRM domain-containing protein n=1 Tax=Carnegiea gigantea TaxID=171969 RepID=A0A9Q1JUN2_9CARY|nr:hypothetical protein Cgig2_022615 [Carnegiea gigantea]